MPTSRGLLFFNTVQRLPHQPTTVAIHTFSVSFVMWAVILTYSFLYRCLAVRSKEEIIFNRWGWAVMIIIAISTAVFFSWICSTFGPSNETLDLLAARVYNITGKDVHTLSFVGGEFFVSLSLLSKLNKFSESRWIAGKRLYPLCHTCGICTNLLYYYGLLYL